MDLFGAIERPKPTKVGQANGEFLAAIAAMPAHQRKSVRASDFPYADARFVAANARFHGGAA